MRINKRLFQSKTVEDNDILSYHFKEQCRMQRRINATMPHLKSLHDQPSVRVKANGAIVLNRYHNTSLPSDWVSSVISRLDDSDDDDDFDITPTDDKQQHHYALEKSNSDYSALSNTSTVSSSQSFLSATPLRKRGSTITAISPTIVLTDNECHALPGIARSSSLPILPQLLPTPSVTSSASSDYHFTYEKKLDILLEEMEDVQQEGARMKKNYLLLERRNKLLEKELDQRDQLIHSLQTKIQSLMKANT